MVLLLLLPPEILCNIYQSLDRDSSGNWCLSCKGLWKVRRLTGLKIGGVDPSGRYLRFLTNQRHGRHHIRRLEIDAHEGNIQRLGATLSHLVGLESISLHYAGPSVVASLAPLVDLPGLRSLSLVGCSNFGSMGRRALRGLTQLTRLEVRPRVDIDGGWDWLFSLGGLRDLTLGPGVKMGRREASRLSELTRLESLQITWKGTYYEDYHVGAITTIGTLRSLSLNNVNLGGFANSPLCSLRLLRELTITGANLYRGWTFEPSTLQGLDSLESLRLVNLALRPRHLEVIAGLRSLVSLDMFEITYLSHTHDTERQLQGLTSLRTLGIDTHALWSIGPVGSRLLSLIPAMVRLGRLTLRGAPEEVPRIRARLAAMGSQVEVVGHL